MKGDRDKKTAIGVLIDAKEFDSIGDPELSTISLGRIDLGVST